MSRLSTEPSPGSGEGFSYEVETAPWAELEARLGEPDLNTYVRPAALLRGRDAGAALDADLALPLAGGRIAFGQVELVLRLGRRIARRQLGIDGLRDWLVRRPGRAVAALTHALGRLSAPRPP